MQERTQQDKLPVPEVGPEKRFFAEESIDVGRLAQAVADLESSIELEKAAHNPIMENIEKLEKDLFVAYKTFYGEAQGLMRLLKPHLVEEDRKEFKEIWEDLKDSKNPERYRIDTIDRLCDFLLQALKNANLSEMGQKSRIHEIIGEIDLRGI